MVGSLSLARLGVGLAVFLLRASDAVADPSFGGVAELIREAREGWRGIAALRGISGRAVDSFGGRIASRLEDRVAEARRRCEEQGVDACLLRGAVTEVELLLEELAKDDAVVVAAVRNPDSFGEVIRGRVQRRRRKVEAAVELFFDELVRAVTGEFVRLAPGSKDFQIGPLWQLLDAVDAIRDGIAHLDGRFDQLEGALSGSSSPRPSRIRLGSRPMEVSGFVERREQEGLFGAVLSGASGRTVLTGMRGSGKSQLATAVAARCEAEDWPLVAWVPAGSREAVLSGLAELGRELGVDVEDGPSREVIARRCLTALASAQGSDRLIVFDDVENPDDLVGLVPRGEGVRVLVTTTRLADWEGAGWVHVPVGVFEREQSIGILLDRTDQTDRGAADVGAADAVAGALGDLPVAVVQAAATARRDRYTLAAYLEVLERTTLEEGVRRREGDEYPGAVGAALRLALQGALERIEDQSPRRGEVARVQLGVLSVLAATGVPAPWLEKMLGGGSDDARGALSGLIESSVCQLSKDDSKVMIHGLQGRVIRETWKDEPERWEQIEEEAAALLGTVADVTAIPVRDSASRRREALDLVEQLRATAGQNYSKTLFFHPRTADALAHALQYATELGDPQAALSLSNAVNLLTRTLGPNHPDTLVSRGNLAAAYLSAGRLEQAVPLFERNLTDRERVLGPDHTRTLASRGNLASAYLSAGRLEQAVPLFERNLTDHEYLLGPGHPHTLTSRNNLAAAYQAAGRLEQAIDLFERNLVDCERVLGPDHPDTLASQGNLAAAYQDAGKLKQAIDLHKKNLVDRERILGPDHPHTLTARDGLAAAYRAAGRLDQAIDLLEQNLADYERVLGPDHPDTLASQGNLAAAYQAASRLDQAVPLFEQNLVDCERVLGPDHPDTLASQGNLAAAYQDAGRPKQAIDLLEQNLADYECVLGPDHPHTLTSRNNLASAYWSADRLSEAVPLFKRTLTDRERVLGSDHPDTLISRGNLAAAYQDAGRLSEAVSLFGRTLGDCERVLGPDHPDTLSSRGGLAGAYQAAGRPDQAIPLFERTLADYGRVLGPDHPHTLASQGNLADAYWSTGRLSKAIDLFERNLADYERVLGPDHPHTLASQGNLAYAYQAAGRPDQAVPLFEQALADRERLRGPNHPDTRLFRKKLADAYRAVGRNEDAAALIDPPPDPDDADIRTPS